MPTESNNSLPRPAAGQEQAFLEILAQRSMLKLYILSIVADAHLAEDILSEVTLVIARSWDRYDRSKPFGPWARGFAKRVALATLRKQKRQMVTLDDDVLESLGNQLDALPDEVVLDEQKQQLRRCMDKLPEQRRLLVTLRYFEQRSYEEIAQRTGRTLQALYMAFTRIHAALADCVGGQR